MAQVSSQSRSLILPRRAPITHDGPHSATKIQQGRWNQLAVAPRQADANVGHPQ
ncbi:MAG: hypothetical protein ACF788_01020 [Novipirellula sp. JB048]